MATPAAPAAADEPDAQRTGACNWSGEWSMHCGTMDLTQRGDQVSGTYEQNAGRIARVLRGHDLIGTWAEAPSYEAPADGGELVLTIAADCSSLRGEWWHGPRPHTSAGLVSSQ